VIKTGTGRALLVTCGDVGTKMPPKSTSISYTQPQGDRTMITVLNTDGTETIFATDDATGNLHVRTPGALVGNASYALSRPLDPFGKVWITFRRSKTIFLILIPEAENKLSMFYTTFEDAQRVRLTTLLTYSIQKQTSEPWTLTLQGSAADVLTISRVAGTLRLEGSTTATFLPYG
jgi:hypothetical protein